MAKPFRETPTFTGASVASSRFVTIIQLVTLVKVIYRGCPPTVAAPTSMPPVTNGFPDTWYAPTCESPGA